MPDYRKAIAEAEWFDIDTIDVDGGLVSTYALDEKDWLHAVTEHMKDGRTVSCISYAVKDGKQTEVGRWTKTWSEITDEQREEGRNAFRDDLQIRGLTG